MAAKISKEGLIEVIEKPKQASELVNTKSGKINIKDWVGKDKWGIYYIECVCECGKLFYATSSNLKRRKTLSCGCYKIEQIKKKNTIHGDSNWIGAKKVNKTYSTWRSIKERCFYDKNISYKRYGAKGVKMCIGYKDSYSNFKNDVGERPSKEYTIDRINTNGHYSCGKCVECKTNKWEFNLRWADIITQNNNKKNTIFVIINGIKMGSAQADKYLGFPKRTVYGRLKCGWDINKIINTPVKKRK